MTAIIIEDISVYLFSTKLALLAYYDKTILNYSNNICLLQLLRYSL